MTEQVIHHHGLWTDLFIFFFYSCVHCIYLCVHQ
jgi:hypothetical protein